MISQFVVIIIGFISKFVYELMMVGYCLENSLLIFLNMN
ncbi:hypothetical protein LCGC14_2586280, partial [marine sediment metagenome]